MARPPRDAKADFAHGGAEPGSAHPAPEAMGESPDSPDLAPSAPAMPEGESDPKRLARIIGANLRHYRRKLYPNWGGQKKFAEFLGLAANDLCVYEYGRIVPNESRQEEIARRLNITVEQLRTPIPGVAALPPAPPRTAAEAAWQARMEELRRVIARLEGRLEAMQDELRREHERAEQLREANYTLRHLLYGDDSPEARERRERVISRLAPSIAELVRKREEY